MKKILLISLTCFLLSSCEFNFENPFSKEKEKGTDTTVTATKIDSATYVKEMLMSSDTTEISI